MLGFWPDMILVSPSIPDHGCQGSIEGSHIKVFTGVYLLDCLMLWLFVGPTGVYLLDFFCSGIQFNLLLSPYPCFISLLYLDLYVLGDDALIS